MLKYMRKYWIFGILSAAFMVAEVYVDMMQPKLMADIVDNGILGLSGDGTPNIPLITSVGLRMILVVLAGGLFGMLSGAMGNICSQGYANVLRKNTFQKVMDLSFQQTDQFTTGSLITRITNDISQVERLVQQLIRGFIRSLTFLVVGTFTLLSLNQSFLTVVLIAFPLVLIDVILVLRRISPLFTTVQTKIDNMNTVIQEDITGARVIKAFVQEDREKQRFGKANDDLVDTQIKILMTISFLRPAMNIILNLATVALIRIGAIQVEGGFMQPGEVMAAVTYISQILGGMMMLAMLFQMMSRGIASGRRINEVLKTEPAIKSGTYRGTSLSGEATGEAESAATGEAASAASTEATDVPVVEFRNVGFAYPNVPEEILRGITLTVNKGETLGIVGATGSGKTSLVNLIARFYDPTEGDVLIDGVNVKEYDLKYLRDKISFVTQKNELFSTTIKENIALGDPDAEDSDIQAAARAAQADSFIKEQPDGYGTAVAEKGASLSGGQRQRIAIARALLKHSPIMIFDDSTSALDLKTEAALYRALDQDYSDVTKIVIAQRISTLQYADKIAVLDDGKLVGYGTNDELLETCDVYKDIVDSQLKAKGGQAA